MKKLLLILFLAFALILSGCGPKCAPCQDASAWSSCNEDAMKTRTAYKCSEQTNFECQSFEETLQCATEVKTKGMVGNSQLVVSPSIEKEVKGIVNIEYKNAPEAATVVAFLVQKGNADLHAGGGENMIFDTEPSDGWSYLLDTSILENGLHSISAVAATGFEDGNPPLDAASVQVIIKN